MWHLTSPSSSVSAALLIASLLQVSAPGHDIDTATHRRHLVTIDTGVRLEVLEWPGEGSPVLLLAGHGDSGHVYDEFAPGLAGDYRVFALSRRGTGGSDKPPGGYDLTTVANDIRQVLTLLHLERVHVVGHSIAGDEMLRLAADATDRVASFIFLDAAYDRVEARRVETTFPPLPPSVASITGAQCRQAADVRADVERSTIRVPMGEILATRVFAPDGCEVRPVTPPDILRAQANAVEPPRYEFLRTPTLAIYAVPTTPAELVPRYRSSDSATRAALDQIFAIWDRAARQQRSRFAREAPHARVVELRGGSHYIFISHERVVLRLVKEFLASSKPLDHRGRD